MNFGTKIRTAIAIIACANGAFVALGVIDFGDEVSNLIYKWITVIAFVAAWVVSHWYNNDFTPEACEGTGLTRALKSGEDGMDTVVEDYIEDGDDDE